MAIAKPRIFIIDTSALFNRIHYAAENIRLATTPLLEKEMYQKGLKDTLELLLATDKLQIIEPTAVSLEKIREVALQLGDLSNLSNPDQQLLALALDLSRQDFDVVIITDDYSIQNVAQRLSIGYKPASLPGIREIIKWETYCGACGHKDPKLIPGEPCPICGTPIKRRAIRKQSL
ncbi:MAG: NOB1 family endonuclease [Candidatus Odinarchaeota archaeon]